MSPKVAPKVAIGLQLNPTVLELRPQGIDPTLYDHAELLCNDRSAGAQG